MSYSHANVNIIFRIDTTVSNIPVTAKIAPVYNSVFCNLFTLLHLSFTMLKLDTSLKTH